MPIVVPSEMLMTVAPWLAAHAIPLARSWWCRVRSRRWNLDWKDPGVRCHPGDAQTVVGHRGYGPGHVGAVSDRIHGRPQGRALGQVDPRVGRGRAQVGGDSTAPPSPPRQQLGHGPY